MRLFTSTVSAAYSWLQKENSRICRALFDHHLGECFSCFHTSYTYCCPRIFSTLCQLVQNDDCGCFAGEVSFEILPTFRMRRFLSEQMGQAWSQDPGQCSKSVHCQPSIFSIYAAAHKLHKGRLENVRLILVSTLLFRFLSRNRKWICHGDQDLHSVFVDSIKHCFNIF